MTNSEYTLDDSASGRNAFYVSCALQSQSVAYCACLNRQKTIETGAFPADWGVCKDAARNNVCKAKQMRHDELVQGRAMFFKPRPELTGNAAAAPEGYFTSKDVGATKRGGVRKKTALEVIAAGAGTGTYSAAIEAAAKDSIAISGAKPIVVPAPKPAAVAAPAAQIMPGESISDFVARLRRTAAAAAPV